MSERSGTSLRWLAAVAVTLVLAGCTPAQIQLVSSHAKPSLSSAEQNVVDSVNAYRAAHGLGALAVNADLEDKGRMWAAWMAGGNCGRDGAGRPLICHSSLTAGITVSWTRLEENVGAASPSSNLAGLETGFQNSPEHSANMLNGQITSIGVGVAYAGDTVFVAEEFMAQ